MKCRTLKLFSEYVVLLLFLEAFTYTVYAQSRIIGTVKDANTGKPLVGVNVVVLGTYLGSATDLSGNFFIVNVPVGTYRVKASSIGYESQVKKDVVVSSDRVTRLEFSLKPTAVQTKEVVVTAEADHLHKDVSSTQMVATGEELSNSASVRSITSFLERQPGVSTTNGFLTIRGGSPDQTGTMINGLSFNNAAVGNAETSIPVSAIEQISLLSGGYNAEYGNFRSGLINVTTKSGSKSGYHGTFSLSMDNSHQRRFGQSLFDPHNDLLSPFLDPSIAFTGGPSPSLELTSTSFPGWIVEAKSRSVTANYPNTTAYDLYLLSSWLFMTNPDYQGLNNLSDSLKNVIGYFPLSAQQKKAFNDHSRKVGGNDYNFDGGFGGPVPFLSKYLGNATFYISNHTSEKNYYIPLVINKDMTSTTLLTVKSTINQNMTLELNGLWKRETGVSPVRPAFGDAPDAGTVPGTPAYGPTQTDQGGFMPQNDAKYFANNPTYWYDPPFFPQLDQTTVMTGLTFNHVLSKSTFYKVTLNRLSISDYSPTVSDNRDTSAITQFGVFPVDEMPYGEWQLGTSHTVDGVNYFSYDSPPGLASLFRFSRKEGFLHDFSKVDQYEAKIDIASQINDENYVKAGIQYNLIDLNHFYWEEWNSNAYNTYEFNYHRKPSQTGAYIQDQISYKSIVANLGVRFDYYYGGGGLWPSDPFAEAVYKPQVVDTSLYTYLNTGNSYIWNIWEQYNKTHPGFLQPIKNYFTVSPRLGISFPVTVNSKFYFNYGQFRSNPPYYSMYQYRYRYDKNGLYNMSNPNLEPPKTISYELGVAYNFYQNYILRVSGYYKDITGQHGQVTYQSSDNVLDYNAWANNQYQDIEGLEINLSKNDNSWITGWVNFNYRLEKSGNTGKSTISDQNINNAEAGLYQGNETKTLPRPELNASITFHSPSHWGPQLGDFSLLGNWSLNFYGRWQAGEYFTYNPLNLPHVTDNLQYPNYYMVDMKLSKAFEISGVRTEFYVNISNVFNLKVDVMSNGNAFSGNQDWNNYLASLHLPIYNSPEYAAARQASGQNRNQYVPGNDKVGDLKSSSKPYIDNPDFTNFFLYAPPRDIWFGMRVNF